MTEVHAYCDAPTGECLKEREIAALKEQVTTLRESLLSIYNRTEPTRTRTAYSLNEIYWEARMALERTDGQRT